MKPIAAIVTGTGYEGRASIIRTYCKDNMAVYLQREPDNRFDTNAIAVYIDTSALFGLVKKRRHIGYIKADRAAKLAPQLDAGALRVSSAYVTSFFAPSDQEHPRVSITIIPE